jgi:hypothetical protein
VGKKAKMVETWKLLRDLIRLRINRRCGAGQGLSVGRPSALGKPSLREKQISFIFGWWRWYRNGKWTRQGPEKEDKEEMSGH